MHLRYPTVAAVTLGAALTVVALNGSNRPADSQVPPTTDFVNFESHPVHPLCLSPDGTKLFVVNTPDARLEIFDITPAGLVRASDGIPVGMEPVSVAARSNNEVWVVNHLSDDISIVDVSAGNVVKSLRVGDEPTDVVFAGHGAGVRAFVCLSIEDRIAIFDPANLAATPTVIPIFSEDPRALVASPDSSRVYVAAFESGNGTTVVRFQDVKTGGGPPPPNPPRNPSLPTPPDVGLIVRRNGSNWVDESGKSWNAFVPYTVADQDLFVIDADGRTLVRAVTGVGTLNFNLTVHPTTGKVWVTNTEALSATRFEPILSGGFIRNRVSIVDPVSGTVSPVHLNPHINYSTPTGTDAERSLSLAQPTDVRFLSSGAKGYVAALGSNLVGVLDGAGNVTSRIEVGQGPVGLAVDGARNRLYVLNRFDHSISIVNTTLDVVVGSVSVGFDPTPQVIRDGRPFLYDAERTSGHGDVSCASCHAFANFDGIAWDLGNPQGTFDPPPPGMIDPALEGFDPQKGPMVTQSLRGMQGTGRLHWRADRADFLAFNPAFHGLLGRPQQLTAGEMQAINDFIMTVSYPPNPAQNLDRTMPDPITGPSAARGQEEFLNRTHDGPFTCNFCHQVPPGTSGQMVNDAALLEDQDMKIPQLRNLYEKSGMSRLPSAVNRRGYGFTHDGAMPDLIEFLQLPVFQFADDAQRRDVEAFLFAFDTGVAPAVGRRVTVDGANKNLASTIALLDTLIGQAEVANIDLIVHGKVAGLARGYLYDPATDSFRPDRAGESQSTTAALRALAGAGSELTYMGVPPGSGLRMGLDRDRDTFLDRDELDTGSNPGNPLSTPSNVAVGPGASPARITLLGGAPNPFGARGTSVRFELPLSGHARLEVFDAMGRRVRTLLDGRQPAGPGQSYWDGRDERGRLLGPGVYFYRLEAFGQRATTKAMRL